MITDMRLSSVRRQVTRRIPVALAALTLALIAMRRLDRVEVDGVSMIPALHPGDRLVIHRTRRVAPGDVVACRDPRRRDRVLVKRVVALTASAVVVAGDRPDASTDSRHFGPVARHLVLGRAVYRYAPDGRRGLVGWL